MDPSLRTLEGKIKGHEWVTVCHITYLSASEFH